MKLVTLTTLALASMSQLASAVPQGMVSSALASASGAVSSATGMVSSAVGGATSTGFSSAASVAASSSAAPTPSSGSGSSSGSGNSTSPSSGSGSSSDSCTGNVTYIESSGPDVSAGDISFGSNTAVLFLDYVAGIVQGVRGTCDGDAFLNASATWSEAVHQADPKPLIMYSRLYFYSDEKYEVATGLPYGFSQVVSGGNFTQGSNASEIVPEVEPQQGDFVFQKIRYSAIDFNDALLVLRSQNITDVVLSGIRVSGVILSSAYPLFDNNFRVWVISNTTAEPGDRTEEIKQAVLGPQGVIPKLPANVISLEQAMQAIGASM
ncbi:Isochorismatase hydrolase [Testicularia cyperi]|uniref:Isochorismatase hydrolase n=1 Tax=Testicularia cyperi TaxID=1882483 RepID=A0A317XJ87_9BASI|nr:Isochorismatase hydrolase [Testicularia cyperi]